MQAWMPVWTFTWIVGMVIFTVLAILVTVLGAKDLIYLLRNLKDQHQAQEQAPPADADAP